MFSNAQSLPPLSAFTSEYRPLRLTTSQAQPLPTGGCRFILLHPSISNQRCTCQSFHHNGKPGSTCDCGHQACYHVHTPPSTGNNSPIIPWVTHNPPTVDNSVSALLDRISSLEQALEEERQARLDGLKQEQRLRERDIRILREALHPFYRTENGMRKKLVELEDRIEGNYDEQVQMKERLIEVDDAAMMLEKRLDELDGPRPKRRRFGRKPNPFSRQNSPYSESSIPPSDPSEAADEVCTSIGEAQRATASSPRSMITPMVPSGQRGGRHGESSASSSPLVKSYSYDPPERPKYEFTTVFYNHAKPNVDSATLTDGMPATAMPMFHSSLAPGSDPEGGRTDEEASPSPDDDLVAPEDEKAPIVVTVADVGVDNSPRNDTSVSDARCRNPG